MQKPFSFQTDITYRASVIATEEQPNGVLVTIELNKLSEHEQPSKATRLIAVIPPAVWAQGPDRIAPMLKLAIASEMNSCFILRSLEHSGKVLVMPKSGVDDTVGVRVIPDPTGAQGTFSGIFESLGRTARVWLDHATNALSAVDGRFGGAVEVGAGPIPPPFPYGPGRAAREAWFSKHGQHQHARQFIADLQGQIDSLQALADIRQQTEVQRLARIASKLSVLTGADMPDGASVSELERWIAEIQDLNLRSAGVGVVRKAELATALRVAAIFYSKLGITMPMPSDGDTVTSLAQGIADTAATEIDRRDRACDEARWRIERIASEIERVSGENFGIPVRTDPLLEDYAIRWVGRMRKKMVNSEITKAVVLHGQFPGLRDGVTTEKFLPQDQRKDPIDAFWVGFKLCEQRAAEALRQSFDAGGSALDDDESPTEPPASESLLDLFNVVEFSWDGSGAPIAFPAIRMLPNDRIVGVIDGEVASVEARIASLEFAQSTKALLRKRWVNQGAASSLRFVIDSFEFCTVRSNAEGRTCVSVTLKLSVHEEQRNTDDDASGASSDAANQVSRAFAAAKTIPRIEVLRHHPAEDLSALVASIFMDPANNLLRIFNSARASFTQIWGRIEERPGNKLWLYGVISGQRKLVADTIDELHFNKLLPAETKIVRAEDPSDTGLKVRFLRGEVRTNESVDQPGVVNALVNIQLEPVDGPTQTKPPSTEPDDPHAADRIVSPETFVKLAEDAGVVKSAVSRHLLNVETFQQAGQTPDPAKDPQDDPHTVRFHCGTCEKRYTVARENVAAKNIMIKCANCGARLEVTPVGAVVVERGTVPRSGTIEGNNQPALRETPQTSAVRRICRPMEGDWSVKGEPQLSASRQPHIGPTLLFRGKPVEPGSAEWTAVADRVQALDADASNSNIVDHESSVQIHFEDLSNGETVNEVGIVAILTRGDVAVDDSGCRSWSVIGSMEGEPEWVSKVQGKLERLNETKGHVMVIVHPRIGESYTIRAKLYGTNVGSAVPSQYEFGNLKCVKAKVYTTLIEVRDPSSPPSDGGSDTSDARRDMAPVTPRSQRDPDDLARIEAQPRNLRTIVEEAHELLSQYDPSEDPDDPDFFATEKARRTDPLLHRIRLLGDAWQKMTTIANRVLRNYDTKPSNCPEEELAIGHRIAELLTGQTFKSEVLAQPEVRAYFRALRQILREVHADAAWANNPLRELVEIKVLSVVDVDVAGNLTAPQGSAAEEPGQARKASFYAPIALEHERREIPELLFRGKPITPTDPEWADLVATVRVLEAQAFPLVQMTVTGPKVKVGANEMVALATSMERLDTNPIKLDCKVTVDGQTLAEVHAAAQIRPEDQEVQAALNNVEALLRGTDVESKEPEQHADLEPGELVRVTAIDDAFYDMVGDVEAREADGRYRVRFMKHGGVSIAFAPSEIERQPKPAMPMLAIATSLQPDPTATPPITEAEANMARKLDEDHRLNMPTIIGLDRVRESSDPIKREPPNVVFHDPKLPLSAIVDREQLAARARDLAYAPGELGANRRMALAEMAAKDPQMAEDVAMIKALIDEANPHPPADER